MKYEMIFGDDGLFFDAQKDCEMVGNGHHKVENGKLMVWNFTEKRWCNSHTNTITISAMRRIIAEPKRWTVEDQKAGRLPDVGAKCRQGHKDEIVVAVTEKFVVTECQDMSVCTTRKDVFMRSYNPIETPEEKAARLCNEWCKTAADIFVRHPSRSGTESMEGIYKAMLSGDLPAPGKE